MKVLIVNDFYNQGGAEVQAHDLFTLLNEHGYETHLLTFDPKYKKGEIAENEFNYKRTDSLFGKFINKFFINFKALFFIKKIIKEFKPDIVHIHNNLKMTKTVNKCIKKLKIIQTFHDFGFVCPKGTCVKDDGTECGGYFCEACSACGVNKVKKRIKIHEIKSNKKWINKHVLKKLCPSEYLSNKLNQNGFIDCKLFPNIIDFDSNDNLNFAERKNFLYCGVISEEKGIVNLIKAFKCLAEEGRNSQLIIVGGISANFNSQFNDLISGMNNIKYLGRLPHDEVIKIYAKALCLIVPSLWLENYPNVMLEAILSNTLCIGSNRGGIVEILDFNKDLMFSPTSVNDIVEKILYISSLSDEAYKLLVESLKKRILRFNSRENVIENYVKEVSQIETIS